MTSKLPDPTQESPGDIAHALIRSALGAIPVGGNAAVELFNAVIMPPLEKRRRAWMADIGNSLAELQAKIGSVDVKQLGEDEEFISLLASATQLAIKTHRTEKLDSLRNAVLNSACGRRPSEDLQATILALIDRFTPLHLRLLRMFSEGFVWSNEGYPVPDEIDLPPMLLVAVGSYNDLLEMDRTLLSIVLRDLITNELIQHWIIDTVTRTLDDGSFYCTVKQWKRRATSEMQVAHGVAIRVNGRANSFVTRTTHVGSQFIRFVSRPPVES